MSNSTSFVRGFGGAGFVLLVSWAYLGGCGGAVADDGAQGVGATTSAGGGVAAGSGGRTQVSGSGGRPVPSLGGGPSTAVPAYCYGVVEDTSVDFCVGLTQTLDPFDSAEQECVLTIPISAGLHLNPAMLRLYFALDSTGRLEIPYIGDETSCPTSGTTGGWYATNVTTAGSSSIGLCGCTCATAKKYKVTLEVDCAGVQF